MKSATVILLFSIAHAEQYSFDLSDFANPKISQPGTDHELFRHRLLQSPSCSYEGDKLVCDHAFEVETNNTGKIIVQFSVRCDGDSLIKFNYQKAANCQCNAMVSSVDGMPPKMCPCSVCQAGFGDVPVNVDCTLYEKEYLAAQANNHTDAGAVVSTVRSGDQGNYSIDDTTAGSARIDDIAVINGTNVTNATMPIIISPYIVGTCTSIDCGAACNGTCDLNCANSGTACPYCANAAQNQPTATPTGAGNGIIPFSDMGSGTTQALVTSILTVFTIAMALALV